MLLLSHDGSKHTLVIININEIPMKILQSSRPTLLSLLLIVLLPLALFAGQTGKLVGKITDKKSREPVIGVSVLLQGTKLGASSDFEGEYIISNIPPGTYTLVVSSQDTRPPPSATLL